MMLPRLRPGVSASMAQLPSVVRSNYYIVSRRSYASEPSKDPSSPPSPPPPSAPAAKLPGFAAKPSSDLKKDGTPETAKARSDKSTKTSAKASTDGQTSSTEGNAGKGKRTFTKRQSGDRPQKTFAPPLMKRVLHIRRVSRVNSGGKVRSISALVVVGNGNGAAGYGEGRAVDAAAAVQKATKAAEKNMTSFYRFNNRTIFSNIDYKWHNVQLQLRSAPPGYGVVASNHIHEVCRCIGISDMGAKVYGSRNPMNVIKATFAALLRQRSPEDIARARGKKVEDVELAYYGHTNVGNDSSTPGVARP
ncbi:28S ribosomal protein S5, mitochondrial [Thoreauomyces humboldtii]|nr:28S ribosomal protein S5, mitochondrial [Thoreauomyces humboldtii]